MSLRASRVENAIIFRVDFGTLSDDEIPKKAVRGSSTIVWPTTLLIVSKIAVQKSDSRGQVRNIWAKSAGDCLHLLQVSVLSG